MPIKKREIYKLVKCVIIYYILDIKSKKLL